MNELLTGKRSFIITVGLLTAVAALTVDLSLPAVPSMARALMTDLSRGQLIVGVFMAGMALGQIPSGLFSDRLGRLPVLYAGMLIFAIAAVVASAAGNISIMLLARFIQGMGAASAVVVSRAIVRDISSGKEMARLMSLMTMIFTAAPVIAPTFGALLVTQWGWRAPFVAIAVCGFLMILSIREFLVETHTPNSDEHPGQQLLSSVRLFFSFRRSIFGLLLIIIPPAGFLSVIAVSAALTVEIYGFTVQQYGFIFACAGLAILVGSAVNRILVSHFELPALIRIGVFLIGLSSVQLFIIALLDQAPFWWLWSCVCLYMFTIAILLSNATVLALDPLPNIAGVASSVIGTSQNVFAALGAIGGAMLYDGSVRNSVAIMSAAGICTVLVFLAKPLILNRPIPKKPEHLGRG